MLQRTVDTLMEEFESVNKTGNEYKVHFKTSLLYESRYLNNTELLSQTGDTVFLKDLVSKNSMLILRYPIASCKPCSDTLLVFIEKLSKVIGNNRIGIISSYINPRDFHYQSLNSKSTAKFYNSRDGHFGIDSTINNSPYFFVLNEQLEITHFFIPNISFPGIITTYFEIIEQKMSSLLK
jgi:hypothetical protein